MMWTTGHLNPPFFHTLHLKVLLTFTCVMCMLYPSIDPSIFYCLSGVRLQGQQPKHGRPDFCLPVMPKHFFGGWYRRCLVTSRVSGCCSIRCQCVLLFCGITLAKAGKDTAWLQNKGLYVKLVLHLPTGKGVNFLLGCSPSVLSYFWFSALYSPQSHDPLLIRCFVKDPLSIWLPSCSLVVG